ncbi:uncharacterized protein LOC111367126 [Olea europaea var. sylvestris]|uniref:uncharacterized protein LOC111367126 n=1 Tax=Olea europaea var. sylvestris TaxID=158386 RepID=UPI000C1CF3C7|nr:uncharacterized protein LOC111367126 [Olea europaea var. sylvestris]
MMILQFLDLANMVQVSGLESFCPMMVVTTYFFFGSVAYILCNGVDNGSNTQEEIRFGLGCFASRTSQDIFKYDVLLPLGAHPNWQRTELFKSGSSQVAGSIHEALGRQGFLLEGRSSLEGKVHTWI